MDIDELVRRANPAVGSLPAGTWDEQWERQLRAIGRSGRRRRRRQATVAALSVVLVAAVVVVAAVSVERRPTSSGPSPARSHGSTARGQGAGGRGLLLVALGGGHLALVSPSDGRTVRTFALDPRGRSVLAGGLVFPGQPGSASSLQPQLAVSPDGKTAYVAVRPAAAADLSSPSIAAVPLDGGPVRIVANAAVAPAVSPDGKTLAYASLTSLSESGASTVVTLLDLANGRRAQIVFHSSFLSGGPDVIGQLDWLSERQLLVSSTDGIDLYGSLHQVWLVDAVGGSVAGQDFSHHGRLRVGRVARLGPITIPPVSHELVQGWRDATADGGSSFLAVSDTAGRCSGPPATSCAAPVEAVVRVDARSGTVTRGPVTSGTVTSDTVVNARLPGEWLSQLTLGPRGKLFAVATPEAVARLDGPTPAPTGTLVRVVGHRLVPLRSGVEGVGWDPAARGR